MSNRPIYRHPKDKYMKKRSVVIGHHKTSISIEDEFWEQFTRIAHERGLVVRELISEVDAIRDAAGGINLCSAIRIYVLNDAISRAREATKVRDLALASVRELQSILSDGYEDTGLTLAIAKAQGRINA